MFYLLAYALNGVFQGSCYSLNFLNTPGISFSRGSSDPVVLENIRCCPTMQEKFSAKMEVRLFSKRNKTISLVFLDSKGKCYDV